MHVKTESRARFRGANTSAEIHHPANPVRAQDDELLCTKDVARLTKLSASFFEKSRLPGLWNGLPWYKVGGRVLYRKSEVFAWLETCRMSGGECHD